MTVHRDSVLLQLYARAPAPNRDYYGLTVTENWVILNIWNISYGPHVFPKRYKLTHADFSDTKYLQEEVRRLFGQHVLYFVLGLSKKERNLQYLPTKVFLYILRHLATNDILRLSQASKIFFDLCNSNDVWKLIYRKKIKKRPTYEDNRMAEDNVSWMDILKRKYRRPEKTTTKSIKASNQNAKLNNAAASNQVKNKVQQTKNKFSSSTNDSLQQEKQNVNLKGASKGISNTKTTSKSHTHLTDNKVSSNTVTKKNNISTSDLNKGKGDFDANTQRNMKNKTSATEAAHGAFSVNKTRNDVLKSILSLEATKKSTGATSKSKNFTESGTNKKFATNTPAMSKNDEVKQKIFNNLLKM